MEIIDKLKNCSIKYKEGEIMHAQCGRITLFSGGMFSGKTEALFRELNRYKIRYSVVLFKPEIDNRYSKKAASHNNQTFDSQNVTSVKDVDSWLEANEVDVIGIDEAQFLDATEMSLVELAEKWANKGKVIFVAALDKDFEGKPFTGISELWVASDGGRKFNALCTQCGEDASFSHRTVDSDEKILVGGSDAYEALCRSCYGKVKGQ
jgi:thymidine kinase